MTIKKIPLLCCSLLLTSSVSMATEMEGERLDYEACRVLVQKGEILSMAHLMARSTKESSEQILDAYLIRTDQRYIYEIESLGIDGVVRVFYLDATTGDLVSE